MPGPEILSSCSDTHHLFSTLTFLQSSPLMFFTWKSDEYLKWSQEMGILIGTLLTDYTFMVLHSQGRLQYIPGLSDQEPCQLQRPSLSRYYYSYSLSWSRRNNHFHLHSWVLGLLVTVSFLQDMLVFPENSPVHFPSSSTNYPGNNQRELSKWQCCPTQNAPLNIQNKEQRTCSKTLLALGADFL